MLRCWLADFSISRLVPTVSKAISTRASPPIFCTDSTRPRPKALCCTLSPFCRVRAGDVDWVGMGLPGVGMGLGRAWGEGTKLLPLSQGRLRSW